MKRPLAATMLMLISASMCAAEPLITHLDTAWQGRSPTPGDQLEQVVSFNRYTSPVFTTVDQYHAFETTSLLLNDWSAGDRLVLDLANPQDFKEVFGVVTGPGGDRLRTGMMSVGLEIAPKTMRRIVLPLSAMSPTISRKEMEVIHLWTMGGEIGKPFSLLLCGAHLLKQDESVADLPMPKVAEAGITSLVTAADPDYQLLIVAQDPTLAVDVVAIRAEVRTMSVLISNHRATPVEMSLAVLAGTESSRQKISLPAGAKKTVELTIPLDGDEFHDDIKIEATAIGAATPFFSVITQLDITSIAASGYGLRLPDIHGLQAHTCHGTRKVGRQVPLGNKAAKGLEISLAAGEREGVQLVLTPPKPAAGASEPRVTLTAGELRGPAGALIPASALRIEQVCYLNVTTATGDQKMRGWWPDPLAPVTTEPVVLAQDFNTPFVITVHAAPGTPAGVYNGSVTVRVVGQDKPQQVPLQVTVWGFTLPESNHLRSCFGLIELGNDINRYFDAKTPAEKAEVRTMFLKSYKEHRVSPNAQNTSDLIAHPVMTFSPSADNATEVTMDFTNFDCDMGLYLDELAFDTQCLPMDGLDEFGGHKRGTAEHTELWSSYLKQYEAHLIAKGWVDKTIVYTYDEPTGEMLTLVQEVYGMIRRVAPRIQTISPMVHTGDPKFKDVISVWCPLAHHYDPVKAAECRAVGEQTWWYLCLLPKPPHFNIFIDAPSIDQRSWTWRSWDVGATGILMWTTIWWTSPMAFPAGTPPQDPWVDPMAYGLGGNLKPGDKSLMANGDGRYMYPPRSPRNADGSIAAPCSSLRWEAVRDGMEDYEYLWKLNSLRAPAGTADPVVDNLLKEITTMFASPTRYDTSVERLGNLRARIAAEIIRRQALGKKS